MCVDEEKTLYDMQWGKIGSTVSSCEEQRSSLSNRQCVRQCGLFLQPLRVKERESLGDTRLRTQLCPSCIHHTLACCASRLSSPVPGNGIASGNKREERPSFQNPQVTGTLKFLPMGNQTSETNLGALSYVLIPETRIRRRQHQREKEKSD